MVTTLIAGTFATGKILQRAIPVRTGSCEVVLNAAGTITAAVRLPAKDPDTGTLLSLVADIGEGRSFLGYVQDGRLLNAGPVWSSNFDGDSQVWTISAAGARSYLDYRFILPVLDDANLALTPAGQSLTYSNLSLRTIAKRLLQNAIAANGGSFPVDFEGDVVDTNTRTYDGLALKRVNEALSDLSGVLAGPDIMLIPYITADGNFVRWTLTTGNQEIRQSGNDHVFDTSAVVPNVTSVSVSRNATTLATTAYELGATTQDTPSDGSTSTSTTLAAKRHDNTLIAAGYPRLEVAASHTDVIVPSTLQGYADDDVNAGRYYTDTYTLKSRIDLSPSLKDIAVGDYAQVRVRNHPILGTPVNPIRVRILSISATRGESTASIACAPVRTTAAY